MNMNCICPNAAIDSSWLKYPLELEEGHAWLNTQLDRKGPKQDVFEVLRK